MCSLVGVLYALCIKIDLSVHLLFNMCDCNGGAEAAQCNTLFGLNPDPAPQRESLAHL